MLGSVEGGMKLETELSAAAGAAASAAGWSAAAAGVVAGVCFGCARGVGGGPAICASACAIAATPALCTAKSSLALATTPQSIQQPSQWQCLLSTVLIFLCTSGVLLSADLTRSSAGGALCFARVALCHSVCVARNENLVWQ